MKKNTVVLFAIAIAIGIGLSCGFKHADSYLEMNVEALSAPEMSEMDGSSSMCSKTGTAGTYYMKNCKDCNGSFGQYAMDEVAFCNI